MFYISTPTTVIAKSMPLYSLVHVYIPHMGLWLYTSHGVMVKAIPMSRAQKNKLPGLKGQNENSRLGVV